MLEDHAAADRAIADTQSQYILNLYITGHTVRSMQAVVFVRALCENYLKDNFELRVIDVYQQPQLIQAKHLLVLPTLVKLVPRPLRWLAGDMSDGQRILKALEL